MLHPTDIWNINWTAFQFFFNVFTLFYASLFIVFDFRNRLWEITHELQPVSDIYKFNVFLLIGTSFLDMLKQFNTAFYEKGETIVSRRSIAINYLKRRFIFDAISLFSVVMNRTFCPGVSPLLIYKLQFLFFFKLIIISDLLAFFKRTFTLNEKYDNFIQLIKLFGILLFTSHVMAILYHVIIRGRLTVNHLALRIKHSCRYTSTTRTRRG